MMHYAGLFAIIPLSWFALLEHIYKHPHPTQPHPTQAHVPSQLTNSLTPTPPHTRTHTLTHAPSHARTHTYSLIIHTHTFHCWLLANSTTLYVSGDDAREYCLAEVFQADCSASESQQDMANNYSQPQEPPPPKMCAEPDVILLDGSCMPHSFSTFKPVRSDHIYESPKFETFKAGGVPVKRGPTVVFELDAKKQNQQNETAVEQRGST